MKRVHFFVFAFGLMASAEMCWAQTRVLDIPALLQLVSYSKSEHSRQVDARNKQAEVLATETANKTLLVKMKEMQRTLQNRFSLLGTAINAAQIGLQAYPMVRSIINSQSELYDLAEQHPESIPLVAKTEIEFAKKSELLVDYLAGLILCIGDVNQMKSSDRKLLFDYVLSELSIIQDLSNNLVRSIRYGSFSSLIAGINPFRDFISVDKNLVEEIIRNAKYLKR